MIEIKTVDIETHPLQGISLIEASAGTGKTFTITHLYVRCLLETDYNVDQILVVTFTNAATQELKQRIQELIYQLWDYLNGKQDNAETFCAMFECYQFDKKAIRKLQVALINFDQAAIYSIHGFCQRVLNTFPIETHSLLHQQIIPNEKEIQQQAIRDYWRKKIISNDPVRLRWIISQWKEPDNLLADIQPLMEFESLVIKTEQQIDDRFKAINMDDLWSELKQQWLDNKSEIYKFLLESKALNRSRVRKPTVTKLLESLEGVFLESQPYRQIEKWELITTTKLKTCQNKNEDSSIDLVFFELAEAFEEQHTEWIKLHKKSILVDAAKQVFDTVQQQKKEAQKISFNDLIKQLSLELESTPSLGDKIKQLYPLAMVDEFQDTDFRQYHIFRALYNENNSDGTLILIGDPKQAIYSFRGADVFTYQQAKADTQKHYTLDINYRSTEPYVEMVNQIFKYNKNSFLLKNLIQFQPVNSPLNNKLQILENDQPVTPLVCWISKFDKAGINKGKATEYFAECCAREIYHILQNQSLQINGEICQASDLTILVKTGFQASTMQNKLASLGIKSALQTRDSVFDSDQAREMTLLLEVLINPSNISRLCGLLSTDLFGWNAVQISNLQQDSNQLTSLLEQFKNYQSSWTNKGFLPMFFRLMDDFKSLQIGNHMEGERRITNWLHIAELLQQESERQSSHAQLLHWLQQQRELSARADNEAHQLRLESDKNLVHIVTIHKSKGLQYPVVFMPFMWDVRKLNTQQACYNYHNDNGEKQVVLLDDEYRNQWQSEAEAEEVRLFYVAITRAKYRCYIGWGNIKGAGSSAIAHCLYSENIKQSRMHPNNLDFDQEQEVYTPFDSLNINNQLVTIVQPRTFEPVQVNSNNISEKNYQTKIFKRHVKQQWQISSYSQIATSGHSDYTYRPDHDALTKPNTNESAETDSLNRFNFKKGAKAGNLLHDILENQIFDQPVSETLIRQKCFDFGFDEVWVDCLKEWIEEILNSHIDDFKLAQLSSQQTLAEMEFYLSCNQLQATELNALLHEYDYIQPQQHLDFVQINGFFKGFIDLTFEHDNKYYIADYKSNYLGQEYTDYTEDKCRQAMYEHHYHLQYLIYSLALHRFMKQRIKNYQYEKDFGGVYYLFLRGMSLTEQGYGVFYHKPDIKIIESLDRMFE